MTRPDQSTESCEQNATCEQRAGNFSCDHLLEQEQTEHRIVGARSCNVHGVPRASKDVDIVADFRRHSLLNICRQSSTSDLLNQLKAEAGN